MITNIASRYILQGKITRKYISNETTMAKHLYHTGKANSKSQVNNTTLPKKSVMYLYYAQFQGQLTSTMRTVCSRRNDQRRTSDGEPLEHWRPSVTTEHSSVSQHNRSLLTFPLRFSKLSPPITCTSPLV